MDRINRIRSHVANGSPAPVTPEEDVVIVSALRTPITKARRGGFKDTTPDVLLGHVLQAVLKQAKVDFKLVGDIVVGNVLQPGAGAGMARMAQLAAGIPHTVPLHVINRQCSSGLQAVANVTAAIKAGYYDIGIAAGVECMSLSGIGKDPPTVNWERVGQVQDAMDCTVPMGITSENVAEKYGISRTKQDELAALSHAKAAAAQANGWFKEEITPVSTVIKDKDGNEKSVIISQDDGVRAGTTVEKLAKLRPAFKEGGSTTAGNSSQVSDGAAAVLLMRRSVAKQMGLPILGRFVSYAVAGNDRADVMFETSSGSSGMVEDGVGLGASMNVDARVSPMGRHRTKREDVAEDKLKPKRGQQNASKETGVKVVGDPSRGLSDADPNSIDKQQTLSDIGGNAAQKSEFQEKLLQISHAVGDMQVKIQGKQIEVTFKGALDGEADEKDSKSTGKVPESSFKSDETKQPFADQKVSDTSGSTYDERAEERDNDDNITQVKAQDKDVNVSHKPSNVRFAEVALNADNETHNVEGSLANEPARQSKPSQQNLAGGSVEVPPAKYQGRPRQIPTSQPHESVSKRSAPTVEATTTENNDKSKDTTETTSLGERFRSGKPQQSTDGERGNLRHEEDNSDEDRTDADSTGERVKAQDAGSRSKTDDDTLREQEYRFSSPREELGELKPSTLESASDYQGIHAVDTSNSLRRPPHIQSKNADRSRNLQQKQTSDEGQSDFERDLRTTASKRAAFQESAELKYKDTELRDNRDSNYEGRTAMIVPTTLKKAFRRLVTLAVVKAALTTLKTSMRVQNVKMTVIHTLMKDAAANKEKTR
ncbi:CCR4-NOT transcription complex subunit 3 [Phytophthora nicotianae]|uniref:CCR4-NOT transcription complex subunit 3 n=1 Tax=Phytophthora nicotianae TaxID=4792 RepID=A0A0W8DAN0_PHYNI|nr:CCR4-NOT transcription complex subunit 3 [Phytophthora nicotianae]